MGVGSEENYMKSYPSNLFKQYLPFSKYFIYL